MKRIGGLRRKTRYIFRKTRRTKGKIPIIGHMQEFKEGERVKLSVESAYQKGMYHPMFYGRCGVIGSRKGKCYEVLIADGGKQKTLIVHPVHLKRM